jgi:putative acetyltransferase
MATLTRTDSTDNHFAELVKKLDEDLAIRDGDDHLFYAQFNKTYMIRHAIVAYENGEPAGCGAIKPFDESGAEVKRMYTRPEFRKKGIATTVLAELERWAFELGFKRCVLETGRNQPEAIAMYLQNGYSIIPNYGQYAGIENSVCFEKYLTENATREF